MIGFVVVVYAGWKITKRTKWVTYEEMDLFTGKKEIDEDEAYWKEAAAKGELDQSVARKTLSQVRKFFF